MAGVPSTEPTPRPLLPRLLHSEPSLLGDGGNLTPAERTRVASILLLGTLIYGLGMGSFGGFVPDTGRTWWLQPIFSALKLPVLLTVTGLLTLPAYIVVQSVLGLRSDLARLLDTLLCTQAVVAVSLAAMSPLTLLWYASVDDYNLALLLHILAFAVAAAAGQVVLRRLMRPLVRRNPLHRRLLRFWGVAYAFIGIQMGWSLRPFIGAPGAEVTFFREASFTNAYVALWNLLTRLLSG